MSISNYEIGHVTLRLFLVLINVSCFTGLDYPYGLSTSPVDLLFKKKKNNYLNKKWPFLKLEQGDSDSTQVLYSS